MIRFQYYNPRNLSKEEIIRFKNYTLTNPGSVVISTCQRVEIYSGSGLVPYQLVTHLFRLVSGLESVFLGDSFIQSQVKKAYLEASASGTLDRHIHRLFQKALRTGKLVRSQTGIDKGAINYPQATVNLAKKSVDNLKESKVAVIGVNKLTDTLLRILRKDGVTQLHLLNRSEKHGKPLAEKHNIVFHNLTSLNKVIGLCKVVLSCTSSDAPIISPVNVLKGERYFIDLAVPGDIDKSVGSLAGVKLFTIEDVEKSIGKNIAQREQEVTKAEAIIQDQVAEFIQWQTDQKLRTKMTYYEHRIPENVNF